MKQNLILLSIITLSFFSVKAQDNCDCESNFKWLKTTFEENDAGFAYALEKKEKGAYKLHNESFLKKVKSVNDNTSCTKLLSEWLTFFRSGHLSINRINGHSKELSEQDIIKQFEHWETATINLPEFENYLNTKSYQDYEGIWQSGVYKIAIKKEGNTYIGSIIEADGVYWRKGQVKLKIYIEGNTAKSTFYYRDHSAHEFDQVVLSESNFLQIGTVNLIRVNAELNPSQKQHIKLISANKPFIESISKNTLILRIPSFAFSEKEAIDRVILEHKEQILKTENLIIDIRGNGGGSDSSYDEILPFLYTNPIRVVGMKMLSTTLNNRRMLNSKDTHAHSDEEKKQYQAAYDTLNKHLGEFVHLGTEKVSIKTLETVHAFPKNIGIIINEGNGSTSEQFLLAAKQSKKVKLFGTTTAGILDISNMHFVNSPCNEFRLGYSLSKSMRIPEMAIDGKGISPDYYIDKSIASDKWVDFVEKVLNK